MMSGGLHLPGLAHLTAAIRKLATALEALAYTATEANAALRHRLTLDGPE